ncbi:MAG: hypothetical protein IPP06_18745 [Saprospiraceae bacterium]|nr:hypothetical protein [Candidatus Vicinibacter affinis]
MKPNDAQMKTVNEISEQLAACMSKASGAPATPPAPEGVTGGAARHQGSRAWADRRISFSSRGVG